MCSPYGLTLAGSERRMRIFSSLAGVVLALGAACSGTSTAANRARAREIGADSLLAASIPGARPGTPSVKAADGFWAGGSPSPSVAQQNWTVTGSSIDTFVGLIRLLPPNNWHLTAVNCLPGLSLAATRNYGTFTANASAWIDQRADSRMLHLRIGAPSDRGASNPGTTSVGLPDIAGASQCPPEVVAAATAMPGG